MSAAQRRPGPCRRQNAVLISSPGYYAAFVYDPDGNNIEAVWYDPSKEN